MSAPPPPDKSRVSRYVGQEPRAVVYSRDGASRAVITEDRNRCIRIHHEVWDTGDWEEAQRAHWLPVDQLAHLVDTVEHARKIAEDEFRAHERIEDEA